jgi:predicted RNA-binding Zn-ribbon protein involved in translation (DUF1610 family)
VGFSLQQPRRYPHTTDSVSFLLAGILNCCDSSPRSQTTEAAQKANAVYSKWSFAELQGMIAYKAPLHKSITIKVDAHYTSKACPMCGHTSDSNRPKHGLLFVCQKCYYTLHADLVGARNITMRTFVIWQDWIRTGTLSECPDVSSTEAKAARLQRYAELRWSLDTSPTRKPAGF